MATSPVCVCVCVTKVAFVWETEHREPAEGGPSRRPGHLADGRRGALPLGQSHSPALGDQHPRALARCGKPRPHPPPSLLLCAAQGMERFPQVAVQFRLRSFSSWFPFDFGRSYAYKKTTTTFWTVELDYCHIGALLRQKQHENETRISNRQNCLA